MHLFAIFKKNGIYSEVRSKGLCFICSLKLKFRCRNTLRHTKPTLMNMIWNFEKKKIFISLRDAIILLKRCILKTWCLIALRHYNINLPFVTLYRTSWLNH
jgi:hypothetical protein